MSWIDVDKAKIGNEVIWKQYIYNAFRSFSQSIQCWVFFGDPDETISSATGKACLQGDRKYFRYQAKVIDFFFGKDHCKEVIEWDRGLMKMHSWYDISKLKEMGYPQKQKQKEEDA